MSSFTSSLINLLKKGSITNEDLYNISKLIISEKKINGFLNDSDISTLLLYLNKLVIDLDWRKRDRKRYRLIKKIFNLITINDQYLFPFPSLDDDPCSISIAIKCSSSERAKKDLLKYISSNNHSTNFINYFSDTISNLSEKDIENVVTTLIRNIKRNYKNSLWNFYYFLKKVNHNLALFFNDLLYVLRDSLKQETAFTWEEFKTYPNLNSNKGLLSLTCIQQLITLANNEVDFINIANDILSNLSGSVWDKSADFMANNAKEEEVAIFLDKLYKIFSSMSILSTYCIDLIGSLLNIYFNNERYRAECNKLLDLFIKHVVDLLATKSYNISYVYALYTLPAHQENKITAFIDQISSKSTYYIYEIVLKSKDKILKEYLVDKNELERFDPVKLICSSMSKTSNLMEKIFEIRLAANFLKSVKQPDDLSFFRRWNGKCNIFNIYEMMEKILDGEEKIEINIKQPNDQNSKINLYEAFLLGGELTFKGLRDLYEFEKNSFVVSIRYWLPQLARSFALQLLWEKAIYIKFSNSHCKASKSSINFINSIVNEVIGLFSSPDFLDLCKVLEALSSDHVSMEFPDIVPLAIKYCENEQPLENPFIKFILSSVPFDEVVFDNAAKAISNLSTLTEDDISLFLADDNDVFIPLGVYMDKSTITGDKKARMLKEQKEIRECIRNELLKVEKYFFLFRNVLTFPKRKITHEMIEKFLGLLKKSLVITITRELATVLLTKLVGKVLSCEDLQLSNSAESAIVNSYLAIYSISETKVMPKSIDKLLGLISNKRLSRPLASLILPIPLERLKMIDEQSEEEDGSNALSVLSYQLKQRLDLPVSSILSTLCQIISKSGDSPNKVMIDSIIELAFYPLDEECIQIITDYILSPSAQLRFALSQMISKRRDFLPDLYKFLKILVFDAGPASIPAKNVAVFYRQSKKISSLDPSDILNIKYDKSLEDTMPEMIGKTLATTFFEKDCTFSELVLIITARYLPSPHATRLAILYTIIYLFEDNKNHNYNISDIELILKFLSTVVLQQARIGVMDEIETSTSVILIIDKALRALEVLVLSNSTELRELQNIVERLSSATADSSGISASIITRCCNLIRLLIMIKGKSTIGKVSLPELIHNFLDDKYEMEEVWFLFFSKIFIEISKFEDKRILLNLFNICFERMNKLSKGEKIEFIIYKSTILAASFALGINKNDLPIDKILENIQNGNRYEVLRALNFIINLFKIHKSDGSLLFDFNSRCIIINALFSLTSDSYLPVKQSAVELASVLGQYDSDKLFDTISEAILSQESSNKKRLGAIKFATILIKTIPSLVESFFDIEFLVEASLDSDSQVRSSAIECVNIYVNSLLKSLKTASFPMEKFKKTLLSPIDVNLQSFLEAIETNYNIPFSILQPILKRSLRSRMQQVRIITLKYLKSYKLPSINSLVFYPLAELDEEEAQLVGEVLSQTSIPEDLLTSFKESTIAKSSPHERFCYSKVLSLISNYEDLMEWSYGILNKGSIYYKIHGVLCFFINLNPVVFSDNLNFVIDTISKLLNHENDIVRETSLDFIKHMIESFPDRIELFIRKVDSIFSDFSTKATPSRDFATQLIPILIVPADEKNKEILFVDSYLAKFDTSHVVVQRADQVWRNIASNSRRVLFKILPKLLDKLSTLNNSAVVDSCIESIISLERDLVPGSYTIINPMIDYILENKYIYMLKSLISVSNKALLQDRLDLICQFLKNSCSGPDSSVSIQALGLISKWVKSVMDDSLVFLIEESLYDSSCSSFTTLCNLNVTPKKLLDAWKLIKIRNPEELGGFWDVANLLLSNQSLPEMSNYLYEILSIRNPSALISIPPVSLFWEFGIRGAEELVNKGDGIIYDSVVKSLIEYAPSKTLIIEFAPSVIDVAMSNAEVLHALFNCSHLPSHQGILIILVAYTMANKNFVYNKIDVSRCLMPSILSYLTNLTTTNPSSLGLSFNCQVAYSISFVLKIFSYELLNQLELRICGLLIRAAGDWSNLLYKASLLSALYYLVNVLVNSPRGTVLLKALVPQLLSLSVKSLGPPIEKEKTPMPFNPSYPTFSIQTDPCKIFPLPKLDLDGTPTLLSSSTYLSYSALSLFQSLIPLCLDRSEFIFNELFKILDFNSSQYLFMAMEYIVSLGDFSHHVERFKLLFKPEEKTNMNYIRVIVAHINKNGEDEIDKLVEEIRRNPPALESGLILSELRASLLPSKGLFDIFKYYCTLNDSSPNTILLSRNIAINLFDKVLERQFGDLPIEFLKVKMELNSGQMKAYLKIIEKMIPLHRKDIINDYEALSSLLLFLYNSITDTSTIKPHVDMIIRSLGDSKPLSNSLSHLSTTQMAGIRGYMSKLGC